MTTETGGTVKQFKVCSGEINEIVEAETHEDAAVKVFAMFDDDDEPPIPGAWLSTIEVTGEELWHRSVEVCKKAGRWGGTDASTAGKSSAGNPTSDG